MKAIISVIMFMCVTSFAGNAFAIPVYFSDRNLFDIANPGLFLEDFESFVVAPNGVLTISDPLNSGNSGILPGIELASSSGTSLVALGTGLIGNTSKVVGPNLFVDYLSIKFGPGVSAFGFDLFSNGNMALTMELYGTAGLIGTTVINAINQQSIFFGAFSDILIIEVRTGGVSPSGEAIDNLAFGNPNRVPEPAPMALLSLGLIGMMLIRRRRVVSKL